MAEHVGGDEGGEDADDDDDHQELYQREPAPTTSGVLFVGVELHEAPVFQNWARGAMTCGAGGGKVGPYFARKERLAITPNSVMKVAPAKSMVYSSVKTLQ